MIFHRLQRRYRIGIGCRRRPIKISDFQSIFNILLPNALHPGLCPGPRWGASGAPRPPVEKRCRGPHRIAGPRAPRPHDPPLVWTPAYSRPCYRRQNARVEHSLLEKLTLFPNASIVLEDVDTHRSTLGRRVNAQTKRRQSHVNAGTVPESENART